MFLLDTNVVSEAMRPAPNAVVEAWFARIERSSLFLSSISKAELLHGLALMPVGKRKIEVAAVIWRFLAEELRTDILAFGTAEAEHYAEILALRRGRGRPMSQSDAQIAAIARSRGLALATRNVRDFEDCGVEIVNPWEPA